MKTIINTFITTLIIVSFTLISCSKDEDTPKPQTVTPPTTTAPTSTCPTGYTGTDCLTQITPSKIRINKIIVTRFPQFNGTSTWDIFDIGGSNPELYVSLRLGTSILFNTGYYEDADYLLNYEFTGSYLPYDIVLPTSQFTIRAYDYDTGSDDFMGGVIFTPYNSSNSFPSIITIDGGGSVEFKLYVSYFF